MHVLIILQILLSTQYYVYQHFSCLEYFLQPADSEDAEINSTIFLLRAQALEPNRLGLTLSSTTIYQMSP